MVHVSGVKRDSTGDPLLAGAITPVRMIRGIDEFPSTELTRFEPTIYSTPQAAKKVDRKSTPIKEEY